MLLLLDTTDVLRVVTSSTADIDAVFSYIDGDASGLTAPAGGLQPTAIASIATTTVVAAPGASRTRNITAGTIVNRDPTDPCDVTVEWYSGTTAYRLFKATLAAGESIQYRDARGWASFDAAGREKTRADQLVAAAVNTLNTVVLASDVTNSNATANTMADVTGLSFAVTAGETYWFEFVIAYTAAATTTGSRWAINGPASPTALSYRSEYTLAATTTTVNSATAYNIPAASNATSLTTGNVATIWGTIKPSANGTVIARFASEVASSAIVAKAGSILRWMRTL